MSMKVMGLPRQVPRTLSNGSVDTLHYQYRQSKGGKGSSKAVTITGHRSAQANSRETFCSGASVNAFYT